jgi:hypothetical protein
MSAGVGRPSICSALVFSVSKCEMAATAITATTPQLVNSRSNCLVPDVKAIGLGMPPSGRCTPPDAGR